MMRDKIVSLKQLIEQYRPHESSKRCSLEEELQYINGVLAESRHVSLCNTADNILFNTN